MNCLIECEGLYTEVTHTKWEEMEIIDGIFTKFNKSENHNLDVIYTPWEKIQRVHGWPSSYEKYKFGPKTNTLDGKLRLCPSLNN